MGWRDKHCPEENFDTFTGKQFAFAIKHGLREQHSVLELSCDCLGFGRFAIMYLKEAKYIGVEDNQNQISLGIVHEVTGDLLVKKKPRFIYDTDSCWQHLPPIFDFVFAFNFFNFFEYGYLKQQIVRIASRVPLESKFIGFVSIIDRKKIPDFNEAMVRAAGFNHIGWTHEPEGSFFVAQK